MNVGLKKVPWAHRALTKYPRINRQTHSLLILILSSIFLNHLLSIPLHRSNLPWESNFRQPTTIQLIQQEQRAGHFYIWGKETCIVTQDKKIWYFFLSYVCSKQPFVHNAEDHICYLWECVLTEAHEGCPVMHVAPVLCGSVNWALSGASVWDGCTMSPFNPGSSALCEHQSRISKMGTDHSVYQMESTWNISLHEDSNSPQFSL